jgi:hypothetical protein
MMMIRWMRNRQEIVNKLRSIMKVKSSYEQANENGDKKAV